MYLADQDLNEAYAFYSVPTGGGAALALNTPIRNRSLGNTYAFTEDGTKLVYTADHDTFGVQELYSVHVDGSQPRQKLNSPWSRAAKSRCTSGSAATTSSTPPTRSRTRSTRCS